MASRRSRNRRDKRQQIPRRKACRFESGPGHHGSTAMVLRATCASFRQPFPQNGYFGHASIRVWTSEAWPAAAPASSEYLAAHSPNTTVAVAAY